MVTQNRNKDRSTVKRDLSVYNENKRHDLFN